MNYCQSTYKVEVCYLDTFLSAPTPLWDMKHIISVRQSANPNRVHSHLPHDVWSSYDYLIHYRSEDSCAH